MSLHNELTQLFSPTTHRLSKTISPESVDALAIQKVAGALLRLKGNKAKQIALVNTLEPTTAAVLCRWMGDPTFWVEVGGITKQ